MEEIISEKDFKLDKQNVEIERLSSSSSSNPSFNNNSGATGLERQRAGAARVHGSFRQYKKDKISQKQKDRQSNTAANISSASEGFVSQGSTSLSSEENSSPSSTPKHIRPALKLSLSTGSAKEINTNDENGLSNPKKGILKSSTSYGSLNSRSSSSSTIAELQKLIVATVAKPPPPEKKLSLSEERSDSGRESDEVESSHPKLSPPSSEFVPPKPYNSRGRDSANSSFDGTADSSMDHSLIDSVSISSFNGGQICRLSVRSSTKKKPCPPPRSSTTKLTMSGGKSVTRPAVPAKPQLSGKSKGTVINIVKEDEENKKKVEKKVKFHPELEGVEKSVMERRAIQLLDESIMNYRNPPEDNEGVTRFGADEGGKADVSYFEPYI